MGALTFIRMVHMIPSIKFFRNTQYIGNARKTGTAGIPDTEIQRLKEEVAVQRQIEANGVAYLKIPLNAL